MAAGYSKIKEAFHNFSFSSDGRLDYAGYLRALTVATVYFSLGLLILIAIIVGIVFTNMYILAGVVGFFGGLALFIAFFVAYFCIGARRLHDASKSGVYQLVMLIPNLGQLIYLVILTVDSVPRSEGFAEPNFVDHKMGFTKLKEAFHNLIPSLNGRLTYEQYGRAQVALGLIMFVVMFAVMMIGMVISFSAMMATLSNNDMSDGAAGIEMLMAMSPIFIGYAIVFIGYMVAQIGVLGRRLHDSGRSAANLLWVLVPIIGFIIPFIQALADSDGANEYGPAEADEFDELAMSELNDDGSDQLDGLDELK